MEGSSDFVPSSRHLEESVQDLIRYNRSLFEANLDALVAVTLEGTITDANSAMARITGASRDELLGTNVFSYFSEPELAAQGLGKVLDQGFIRDYPLEIRRRDGHLTPLLYNGAALRNERGEVTGALGSARDITEKKLTEERLQESEERFRRSFEDAAVGMALVGTDGRWLRVNRSLLEIVGYEEDELLSRTFQNITHPDDLDADLGYLRRLLAGEIRAYQMEKRYFHKKGQEVSVLLSVSLVRDGRGDPLYFISQIQDVTDRKRRTLEIERALDAQKRANEKLVRINKIRSDFVSVVSHEFRTALTGIQGFSQMMRDEDFTIEEMKDFSTDINEDARRLGRMIDEMLDLDRMESGRMTLNLGRLDLNEIISGATDLARPDAPAHQISLRLDREIPLFLGDQDKLTQVVENLLANAVKYSPGGGEITVTSSVRNGGVHVGVEDRGVGIARDSLGRLFEPYSTIESEQTRFAQGAGLGLAISQQIIGLHGGEIWAESEPGRGSTFHFTIPIADPRSSGES